MIKNKVSADIVSWNNGFPLDRWWRKKYNIPYLSEAHRKSTFFGQYFEYSEDKIFEDYFKKVDKEEETEETRYIPMKGNWWKGSSISKEEVKDWFNTPIE